MFERLLATTAYATKTQRCSEDWPTPLSRLHGPRYKASSIADSLDMI